MKKSIYVILFLVLSALAFTACSNDESVDVNEINKQTMIVFMPWSGTETSTGLYNIFLQNLDSIEGAIKKAKGMSGRLVVFISRSTSQSDLYEITYNNGNIVHTPIKTYSGNSYTTSEGITEILNDVKSNAYALNYGLLVGCHGCGWTYKEDWENYPYKSKQQAVLPTDAAQSKAVMFGNTTGTNYPTTRFFGSVEDTNYGINVTSLADGIQNAGMIMQFVLFDDCYMANVETAYELRNVTNYLIASTSEVMALGMPYQTIWSSLASATPDYESVVSGFYQFYSSYTYPYGALSAIDCRQVEKLASIMKTVNSYYTLPDSLVDSLQVLDGYSTPIFYDLGDYVDHLCKNTSLLSDFHSQLDNVIKATAYTDSLYSYLVSPLFIKVNNYSGITVSDPSKNTVAIKGQQKTGWWQATH
ncbi:MAG: hypothetical protein I3J02_10640 [Prevotella sp.]|nr:hypothetical protein [Prevotella sp.]